MERYVKGERIRFYYESKRLATGLTDVKIDIIKTDGNKEISQGSMTELNSTNAPGVYYYEWVSTKPGTYLIYCDSLTDDYKRELIEKIEVVGRSSKYAKVMGVHGGMVENKVLVKDSWKDEEKKALLDSLGKINDKIEAIQISINSLETGSNVQSERIARMEKDNSLLSEKMELGIIGRIKPINEEVTKFLDKIELSHNRQILESGKINKAIVELKQNIKILDEQSNRIKEEISSKTLELNEKNGILMNNIGILNELIKEINSVVMKNIELTISNIGTETLINSLDINDLEGEK